MNASHFAAPSPVQPARPEIAARFSLRARLHARIAGIAIGIAGLIVPGFFAPRTVPVPASAQTSSRSAITPAPSPDGTRTRQPDIAGLQVGSRVILTARPQDANYAVTAVRFLLDGHTLAEAGAPGRYVWDTRKVRPGRHVVQVQAFARDLFVGISAPLALIVTDSNASTTVEVPFHTYEAHSRRPAGVAAPRLKLPDAHDGNDGVESIEPSPDPEARGVRSPFVEVYLNGVKQEFAPAARVASAEELQIAPSPQASSQVSPRGTTRATGKGGRRVETTPTPDTSAKPGRTTRRTVWLPARPLLERLGARVYWENASKTLTAYLDVEGGTQLIMLSAHPSGSSAQAELNGRQMELQMPVRLAENAIMVPLTFCTEALRLRAKWQKEIHRVELYTAIAPA